jgi:ABC-type Fe3+/spermidine/putrescine transport system ATPase subunit
VGRPKDLYKTPVDPEVARFFGGKNFFAGRWLDGVLESNIGPLQLPADRPAGTENGRVYTATIRPEDIVLSTNGAGGKNAIRGRVRRINFEGTATRVWVACKGTQIVILTPDGDISPGQTVRLHLNPEKIRVFPQKNGR